MAVLTLQPVNEQMVESSDLMGPVAIALCMGFMLLLGGKLHFSDIESTNDLIETIEYFKRLLEETRVSNFW